MTTTVGDSVGGLPVLPAGHRWVVRESKHGMLFVHLQKRDSFLGFKHWIDIDCKVVASYFEPDITDPRQLKIKVLEVAQSLLDTYNKAERAKAAKRAVLESLTPKETY